jgi:predicted HTH transcriptional regulator
MYSNCVSYADSQEQRKDVLSKVIQSRETNYTRQTYVRNSHHDKLAVWGDSQKLRDAKEVRQKIFLAICRNPGIKVSELAERVDRSTCQVRRHIQKLISELLVHSNGSNKMRRYYAGTKPE